MEGNPNKKLSPVDKIKTLRACPQTPTRVWVITFASQKPASPSALSWAVSGHHFCYAKLSFGQMALLCHCTLTHCKPHVYAVCTKVFGLAFFKKARGFGQRPRFLPTKLRTSSLQKGDVLSFSFIKVIPIFNTLVHLNRLFLLAAFFFSIDFICFLNGCLFMHNCADGLCHTNGAIALENVSAHIKASCPTIHRSKSHG
ncbi:hypothetical protein CLNEO_04850 [Anaerotignum neopropionicum]|uniref:Uncharacterized protein n=1 Tax=Anaerotignum neopropionicum TaxID=36847 RepID=A0A136WIG9_9FIRM|nr:hypothetical protein CLNEO_03560 [Anaerotignum neopropionicum]KXL54379.1 hypothetical protein CLNEO_04850 [Anaerotignum neopropionicum]